MTTMPRAIAPLDVPVADIEQQLACAPLLAALATTHSPSDALAYRLDLFLVTHPNAAVSTDADYPGWTPGGTR